MGHCGAGLGCYGLLKLSRSTGARFHSARHENIKRLEEKIDQKASSGRLLGQNGNRMLIKKIFLKSSTATQTCPTMSHTPLAGYFSDFDQRAHTKCRQRTCTKQYQRDGL